MVVDELAGAVAEDAQLQPAVRHAEEGVVLVDQLRVFILLDQRLGAREDVVDAVDAGLDLDIGRHGR